MTFRPLALWLVLAALGLAVREAHAIERITVEIAELSVAGAKVAGAAASLDLTGESPTARVEAREAALGGQLGDYRNIELSCGRLYIREPRFACRAANLSATGGPLGNIATQVGAELNTALGEVTFEGSGLEVAGGTAKFDGKTGPKGWNVQSSATALDIQKVRTLAAPWLPIPQDLSFDGRFDASLEASGSASALNASAQAQTPGFNFTNEAGTVVAERVAAGLRATATRASDGTLEIETHLDGTAGQALTGALLFDLGANPLTLQAHARMSGQNVEVTDLAVEQRNLLKARGTAHVVLGDQPRLAQARVDVQALQFPAAYTSFLQILLAATDFGQLQTTGTASGIVEIANNTITRFDGRLTDIDVEDVNGKFSMMDVDGDLHWLAAKPDTPQSSYLSWSSGSAYGLSGGEARVDFFTHETNFELAKSTRLPIFDGAAVLDSLRINRIEGGTELAFDGRIEPISLPLLAKAFGWPELQGQLGGRIPGLTYRNRELTVQGDLTANVFDGTIVGRNFRLRDPLGPWPRLFADVTARRLDLSMVTSTFSIGSITGRLDADVNGMELFNWSPVAFDARLYSTPGDRSRKLISQKAVTSISSVGGGGGGVTAALQSGVLRFFDDFRYDKVGISCRLRNEVCLMSGIEPAGMGYYLVKGRGLPRIDIIGNAGRVDWPQLMSQIVTQMRSEQKATVR